MMTRETLDRKIDQLIDEILVLDSMVETATLEVIQALKHHDVDTARRIYRDDTLINARRFELEKDCMITIATQQPIESDLRIVVAVLNILTELERIGDYAEGIAKIVIMIGDEAPLKPLIDIPEMAAVAAQMLQDSIAAFINEDAELAKAVCARDSIIDSLRDKTYRELIEVMSADSSTIKRCLHLMRISRNLERIADLSTNMCEDIIFIVEGKVIKHHKFEGQTEVA